MRKSRDPIWFNQNRTGFNPPAERLRLACLAQLEHERLTFPQLPEPEVRHA